MNFLGQDILQWLVLALGGAMAIGTLLALVRPRPVGRAREGELAKPPLLRSLVMISVGTLASIWALASLATG